MSLYQPMLWWHKYLSFIFISISMSYISLKYVINKAWYWCPFRDFYLTNKLITDLYCTQFETIRHGEVWASSTYCCYMGSQATTNELLIKAEQINSTVSTDLTVVCAVLLVKLMDICVSWKRWHITVFLQWKIEAYATNFKLFTESFTLSRFLSVFKTELLTE